MSDIVETAPRAVEIVRELDRYHGFAAAERWGLPQWVRSARGNPPGLLAELVARIRPQMAPQRLEKIESAPGNGMVPEARDPQDMVKRRDGGPASALDPAGQTSLAV